jgi:polar amino acid transport system substrate-binding protein
MGNTLIGKSLTAAFCVALLALASTAAWAAQKEVRLCFNDWPPYVFAKGETATGISIDVLREAARRVDLKITFQELPWKRCLAMVREGKLDGVLDAMHRPEFLQGPASYSVYSNTFWVHDDSNLQKLDFGALRGKTIGLVSGYEYPDSLVEDLKRAEVVVDYAVDDATNIRKLAFNRIDAIVADFASTVLFVKENNLKLRALSPTHSADKLYPSFNGGRLDIQQLIDRALGQMIADGFVDQVYRDHLGVGMDELMTR